VLPHPDVPGCSSFRCTGVGGEPANADTAANSEVAARYDNRVEDSTSPLLRRGETASSSFVKWSTGRRKHGDSSEPWMHKKTSATVFV
jgi:hypothetical protein